MALKDLSGPHQGTIDLLLDITDDWGVARRWWTTCLIADIDEDILLGRPWFDQANPKISWPDDRWTYPLTKASLRLASSTKEIRSCVRAARMIMEVALRPKEEKEEKVTPTSEKPERHPLEDSDPEAPQIPECYLDFKDTFSKEKAGVLPALDGRTHAIETEPGAEISWGPIYSLAEAELKVLREYLDEALGRGWIRRSISPAGAPVLFVPKKGGQLRLYVDYRALNKLTRKNKAPLPLIGEILNRLQGATIYTKLDIRHAYHRIHIREGDEWKTAFRCRYGHFKYLIMPFGLINTPATFQEFINDVLQGLIDHFYIVYLDDILIFSRNKADHKQHVRQVLERLQQHQLYVNLEKCQFGVDRVDFLGFVVSPKGIEMERSRVEAIATWPLPSSMKDIQIFLRFTGFYRRFIKNYSKIAAPLTDRLKGNAKGYLQLDTQKREAFAKLKAVFQTAPILTHFDPDTPIRVETDTSNYAIGAILSQLQLGRWHPVAFLSRKLQGPEVRYTTPEAEMLAILEAFRTWRHYLAYASISIEVITDHLNHTYLAAKAKLSAKQAASLDDLAPFNFEIIYRPGRKNPADPLSRRPDFEAAHNPDEIQRSQLEEFLKRFRHPRTPLLASTHLSAGATQTEVGAPKQDGTDPTPMSGDDMKIDNNNYLRPRRRDAGEAPIDRREEDVNSIRVRDESYSPSLTRRREPSLIKRIDRLRYANLRVNTIQQVTTRSTTATSTEDSTLEEVLLAHQQRDAFIIEKKYLTSRATRANNRTTGWGTGEDQLL